MTESRRDEAPIRKRTAAEREAYMQGYRAGAEAAMRIYAAKVDVIRAELADHAKLIEGR